MMLCVYMYCWTYLHWMGLQNMTWGKKAWICTRWSNNQGSSWTEGYSYNCTIYTKGISTFYHVMRRRAWVKHTSGDTATKPSLDSSNLETLIKSSAGFLFMRNLSVNDCKLVYTKGSITWTVCPLFSRSFATKVASLMPCLPVLQDPTSTDITAILIY